MSLQIFVKIFIIIISIVIINIIMKIIITNIIIWMFIHMIPNISDSGYNISELTELPHMIWNVLKKNLQGELWSMCNAESIEAASE